MLLSSPDSPGSPGSGDVLVADQPPVEMHWLRVGHCLQLEAMALRGGRPKVIEFPSYAAAIRDPERPERGWTLFDTGYADHFLTATERLPERIYRELLPVRLRDDEHLPAQLAALDIDPGDVRRVVVSHFHADHVAGLRDYPRAEVLAGWAGGAQALRASGVAALRHGLLPAVLPDDLRERLRAVEDRALVTLGAGAGPGMVGRDLLGDRSLVAVDLPGHMPGHLGLAMTTTDGRRVLLAGDAAWRSRAIAERRPPSRLALGAFDDPARARATLDDLHEVRRADPGLTILPAHCPEAAATWHGPGAAASDRAE